MDLNLLADLFQERDPYWKESSSVLEAILSSQVEGLVPSHGITTLYYSIRKVVNRNTAEEAVDWMLDRFGVLAADEETFRNARKLSMNDFEDAVVAVQAEKAGCDFIITRNVTDYRNAPVKAITPREFLDLLSTGM